MIGDFKMADFREYAGIDASAFLIHYGVGHLQGGNSGRYKWGSGKNPMQRNPLSGHYDVDLAKNNYKKAKRRSKYLRTELNERKALRRDAKDAYIDAKLDRIDSDFVDEERDRALDKNYKVAKREKKYTKAAYKEAKAQYKDSLDDLKEAEDKLYDERQREKGQKDAVSDAWTIVSSNPGFRGKQASGRDLRGYAKRHPDEMKSIVTSVLSKIGGMKVTSEYREAYEKEFNEWIKKAEIYYGEDSKVTNRMREATTNLKLRDPKRKD